MKIKKIKGWWAVIDGKEVLEWHRTKTEAVTALVEIRANQEI